MKFSEMSKGHRIATVLSALWLCIVFLVALDANTISDFGETNFDFVNFTMALFIFGVIPLLIFWGIIWVKAASNERRSK
jgi:hypothetical protein